VAMTMSEPSTAGTKFARLVFLIAGVWGVLVLTPMYFLYDGGGKQTPAALTHPDFYYGFASVALAWQAAFFFIATNPQRFRPIMIPAVLEKLGYVATLVVLFLQHRIASTPLPFAAADLVLGVLFLAAFLKIRAGKLTIQPPSTLSKLQPRQ
jgi:hypothetical protein